MIPMEALESKGRFWRIATAGIFFQGGAGGRSRDDRRRSGQYSHREPGRRRAAATISRYGWLFPQLFVGYFAQRARRRMSFYMLGAFGRVICLASLAAVVLMTGRLWSTSCLDR